MRDLLDDDLAELYPVRGSDDVRLARLREQLFAEKPRPRSRNWAGVAAAVVAVVLITGLVVFLRPDRSAPDVAEMPTAPATNLAEAATLLERSQPRGKYRHIRYETWETFSITGNGTTTALQSEFVVEVWLPTAKGQHVRTHRRPTGRTRPVPGIAMAAEYDFSKIYTGPSMWGTVCPTTPCHETSLLNPLSQNPAETIGSGSSALLSPFTTNERKAVLYRQLAAIPGVRYDNGLVTADGSKASFTLDPRTGEVTGYEERQVIAGRALPAGTVLQSTTVTSEWTDQRPS
ncbi:hypothetical protein [Lentzea sp. CC55]|uniref:hypothetical protein n=1 Tax=Lentzea sp. CC55 TaxID=2884909 RepID=UPI001F2287E8|nr:hypothetical protein [Lentzea sp. CC55]MCG8923471.1 hypothetical protein [Lentzea sp. CC55]